MPHRATGEALGLVRRHREGGVQARAFFMVFMGKAGQGRVRLRIGRFK